MSEETTESAPKKSKKKALILIGFSLLVLSVVIDYTRTHVLLGKSAPVEVSPKDTVKAIQAPVTTTVTPFAKLKDTLKKTQ